MEESENPGCFGGFRGEERGRREKEKATRPNTGISICSYYGDFVEEGDWMCTSTTCGMPQIPLSLG
jgi:hypothetical protein